MGCLASVISDTVQLFVPDTRVSTWQRPHWMWFCLSKASQTKLQFQIWPDPCHLFTHLAQFVEVFPQQACPALPISNGCSISSTWAADKKRVELWLSMNCVITFNTFVCYQFWWSWWIWGPCFFSPRCGIFWVCKLFVHTYWPPGSVDL